MNEKQTTRRSRITFVGGATLTVNGSVETQMMNPWEGFVHLMRPNGAVVFVNAAQILYVENEEGGV